MPYFLIADDDPDDQFVMLDPTAKKARATFCIAQADQHPAQMAAGGGAGQHPQADP